MSELAYIKSEIYNRGLIIPLLESMGCDNLRIYGDRIDGSRPTGDSPKGFSVYLDEGLGSKVWTRSVPTTDIYDLVSYFKFGKTSSHEIKKCLYNSKQYIINTLKLEGFDSKEQRDLPDYNFHLRCLNKKKKPEHNKVLPETILNDFIMIPHNKLIREGLSYKYMQEFEIGYDIPTERIVFVYRNKVGELVGIRGRATKKEDEKKAKYFPLYNFSKSLELYNLHRAIEHIIKYKTVYLFEGEKSSILSTQFNHPNTVSFMGSDVSQEQAELIKSVHPEIKFVLCMDKDKSIDDIKRAAKFLPKDRVYAIFDTEDYLEWTDEKADSPVDKGHLIFETLLNNHCYKVFPNK